MEQKQIKFCWCWNWLHPPPPSLHSVIESLPFHSPWLFSSVWQIETWLALACKKMRVEAILTPAKVSVLLYTAKWELGIAWPQSQFPHSCVCEWFLYSLDRCTYFLQQNRRIDRGNIFIAHRHMNVVNVEIETGNIWFEFSVLVLCSVLFLVASLIVYF